VQHLDVGGARRACASRSPSVWNRLFAPTWSAKVARNSVVSGTTSRATSYGSVAWINGLTASEPVSLTNSVWPSAAVWRSSLKATMPEAPGLLSITTG
jgi:hypothetical protein